MPLRYNAETWHILRRTDGRTTYLLYQCCASACVKNKLNNYYITVQTASYVKQVLIYCRPTPQQEPAFKVLHNGAPSRDVRVDKISNSTIAFDVMSCCIVRYSWCETCTNAMYSVSQKSAPPPSLVKYSNTHSTEQKSLKFTENTDIHLNIVC